MTTSPFDPTLFKQMTFTQKAGTEFFPIPVGEHVCTITKSEPEQWANNDRSKSGLKLVLELTCEDADKNIQEYTGREKNTLKYEVMLDLGEDGRSLDFGKGKNVRLGRLQEACGFAEGQPWSFDTFQGQRLIAKVVHAPYKDGIIANVDAVRAA